jgi:hypothetical protein
MSISLEFVCPSCNETVDLRRDSYMELPKIGRDVECPHCHESVTIPQSAETVTDSGTRSTTVDGKTTSVVGSVDTSSSTSDYSTLLTLGKLNSGLGWVVVVVGIVMFVVGLFSGFGFLVFSLPGIGVSILGIGVVAFGQVISCFVDTERHTRDSSETLKQILEKMTEEKSE